MAQSTWTALALPYFRLGAALEGSASPVSSRPTVRRETERGGVYQSLIGRPPTAHAIIPEDPLLPDPDDEIIDDPNWDDDEVIRDPDPPQPPVEEPPPGWGA